VEPKYLLKSHSMQLIVSHLGGSSLVRAEFNQAYSLRITSLMCGLLLRQLAKSYSLKSLL
jgi:hypothetical protein